MVNKEIIRRKLIKMSEYLQELARLEDVSYADYISDFKHKRSVERLIQQVPFRFVLNAGQKR